MKTARIFICVFCALLMLIPVTALADDAALVTIRDLDDIVSGAAPYSEKHSDDGISSYMYLYNYGDSCYQLMQMHADDMVATGLFKQVGYTTYDEASFWQMQYIGPGELTPINITEDGEPFHVELGCASYNWDSTFLSATLGKDIAFGDSYSAPEPDPTEYEDAAITVRDFATFLDGTTLTKAEHDENGSYYQYNYKYGDSCYPVVKMYTDTLEETGLFEVVDTQRYDTILFWEIQYVGPGAEELEPLGTSNGKEYHVEVGCANLSYLTPFSSVTPTSIKLCAGIELGEVTYAEGYELPDPGEPKSVSGFSVQYREVTRPCPVCHGSGDCNLCNGTGTYRLYGEAISCDPVCSFCKGEKTYTVMESYYVPN